MHTKNLHRGVAAHGPRMALVWGRFGHPRIRHSDPVKSGRTFADEEQQFAVSGAASAGAGKSPVERVGECLLLASPISCMATSLYSGAAETVHEIPHRQSLSDDFGCVLFATRIDDDHSFWD